MASTLGVRRAGPCHFRLQPRRGGERAGRRGVAPLRQPATPSELLEYHCFLLDLRTAAPAFARAGLALFDEARPDSF